MEVMYHIPFLVPLGSCYYIGGYSYPDDNYDPDDEDLPITSLLTVICYPVII